MVRGSSTRSMARAFAFLLVLGLANTGPSARSDWRQTAHGELIESQVTFGVSQLPPGKGNPHSELVNYLEVWSAVFDPLTLVDDKGTVQPWLATSWQQDGPNAWVFTLRANVAFSNGAPFTAEAVVSALAYLKSPKGQGEPVAAELVADIANVEATGPLEVRIETERPAPFLPNAVSLLRIPEPAAWSDAGREAFAQNPVGTGPYTVRSWAPGRVSLGENPTSWRRVTVPRLEFISTSSSDALLNGLKSGSIDIVLGIDPDNEDEINLIGGHVFPIDVPFVFALIFNTERDHRLRDPRVRRALNLAVNRQAIVDVILHGYSQVSSQPVPPSAKGFNDALEPYPYDPDAARQLLTEAGFPDGFSFTMERMGAGSLTDKVFLQIASDLAPIGVTMNVVTLATPQFLNNLMNGGWQGSAFPMGYFTPSYDALRVMRNQSCLWHVPWYCDRDAMPAIEAALAEPDVKKRISQTEDIMRRAHETAQGLFLYDGIILAASGPRIERFDSYGYFLLFERLKLAKALSE